MDARLELEKKRLERSTGHPEFLAQPAGLQSAPRLAQSLKLEPT